MELRFKTVSMQDPLIDEVRELYEASFPKNERQPFPDLFRSFHGEAEVLAALEADRPAGIAVLLSYEDLTHILYLAVRPELRGRGYGSAMLMLIRDRYPGQRILADPELPGGNAPNEAEREARIAFYQKNGYRLTEIRYNWNGTDYCIMSNGGNAIREDLSRFWHHFYSE